MGWTRLLVVLVLGVVALADEPAPGREIEVALTTRIPDGKAHLTWPSPRGFAVERTLPRLVFDVPELGDQPLFFRITLGQTQGLPFFAALGRSEESGHYDRLWIDFDRDIIGIMLTQTKGTDITRFRTELERRVRSMVSG